MVTLKHRSMKNKDNLGGAGTDPEPVFGERGIKLCLATNYRELGQLDCHEPFNLIVFSCFREVPMVTLTQLRLSCTDHSNGWTFYFTYTYIYMPISAVCLYFYLWMPRKYQNMFSFISTFYSGVSHILISYWSTCNIKISTYTQDNAR